MWFKSYDDLEKDEITSPNLDAMKTDPDYGYLCFKKEEVYLPKNGYFSLSAMTGDFGDDHDLLNFAVFRLDPLIVNPDTVHSFAEENLENERKNYDIIFEKRRNELIATCLF